MQVEIIVNNSKLKAQKGESLLEVLTRNGIKIPTLCNIPELNPTGACRLCIVENDTDHNLVPACSTPVFEGMKIHTHSPKVLKARQTLIDLLLTNHPDDCLYCDKNRTCELQSLAEELHIRERIFGGVKKKGRTDRSSQGLILDLSKCILCGRCVKVCDQVVGVSALEHVFRGNKSSIDTALGKGLYYSTCIQCGQCINICPTGALREKSSIDLITDKIHTSSEKIAVLLSASSIASIGTAFGIRKFDDVFEMLVAALKDTGFSVVVTDAFGSDIYFNDLLDIVLENIEKPDFKMILTDCPATIQWVNQSYPKFSKLLPPLRSPQQIMGRLIKRNNTLQKTVTMAVMPCIARKTEALQTTNLTKGLPDVDFVVSTHELLRLLRSRGINMPYPKKTMGDKPYNIYSSCSVMHEFNGGITEALIRSLNTKFEKHTVDLKISELRTNKEIKHYSIQFNEKEINFVSLNGMIAANKYFEKYANDTNIHFIEISSCNGGCINGSSQLPLDLTSTSKLLYEFDSNGLLRNPLQNAIVKGLISENVIKPITRTINQSPANE